MREHHTQTTHFIIETKDRQGNWHPWASKLDSRSVAEQRLAQDVDKMSTYYIEAKIVQVDIKTSTTLYPIKYIEIKQS